MARCSTALGLWLALVIQLDKRQRAHRDRRIHGRTEAARGHLSERRLLCARIRIERAAAAHRRSFPGTEADTPARAALGKLRQNHIGARETALARSALAAHLRDCPFEARFDGGSACIEIAPVEAQ